jgi:hypothetical protein
VAAKNLDGVRLASRYQLGILDPQLRKLVESAIVDDVTIARHQPLNCAFVVRFGSLDEQQTFATILSLGENPVLNRARDSGRSLPEAREYRDASFARERP